MASKSNLLPPPIVVPASEAWQGNDGPWSTLTLGFGTPPQFQRVLISTEALQPWTVLVGGCGSIGVTESDLSVCRDSRGCIIQPNESTTYEGEGLYRLGYREDLDIRENGSYFLDTITLGTPGSIAGSYAIHQQMAVGIASDEFYIPLWGIRPVATNLSTLNNNYPSLLDGLKSNSRLPSLSWGYTAGAYHLYEAGEHSFGSLTLGGYDAARFAPHNITFNSPGDLAGNLAVGLTSITIKDALPANISLLSDPINTFIDAGVPHIWLDETSCALFVDAFRLTYNEDLDLYLVNETAHKSNIAHNTSLTFTIANNIASSASKVEITLPYAAFALNLTTDYPGVPRTVRYFPIRRAANFTQYTLGRAFLQHAYLLADHERRQFSVRQTLFSGYGKEDIRTVEPIDNVTDTDDGQNGSGSSGKGDHTGKIIGAGIGGTIGLIILVLTCWLVWRWWKRKVAKKQGEVIKDDPVAGTEIDSSEYSILGELHSQTVPVAEAEGRDTAIHEIGDGSIVYQMADDRAAQELEGSDEKGNTRVNTISASGSITVILQ